MGYLEAQMLERSTKDPNSLYESPYTTHTPSVTTKNNLLSNHPVKSDTTKNNLSVTNNGTLGLCKTILTRFIQENIKSVRVCELHNKDSCIVLTQLIMLLCCYSLICIFLLLFVTTSDLP